MKQVRAYYRGKDLITRRKAVIYDLRMGIILRDLDKAIAACVERDIEHAALFAEAPELRSFPFDGGMAN